MNIFIRELALVLLLYMCALACAYGQSTIRLDASNNGQSTIITDCSQTYTFLDSGGEDGNYGNNENYSYTFESCNPIIITFEELTTEESQYSNCPNYDYLLLYNGTISDENLIARGQTGCTSSLSTNTEYTANSGILIIKWKSDGSTNAAGWKSTIKCSGSTCTPHVLSYNTTANCTGTASNAPNGTTALTATVTSEIPTCSTLPVFLGWNTAQDGSGTSYSAGEDISLLRNDITLYAQYSECETNTIINGSGTTYNVPFCSYVTYDITPRSSYSQMLYTKEQINASGYTERGLIQKISFDYYGTESQEMTFDLYMCNTDFTEFGYNWATGLQTVATNKTITFTPGWVEIELDNDFLWDGTSNLVIAMHAKTEPSSNTNRKFRYLSCSDNIVKYQYSTNYLYELSAEHIPAQTWTTVTETSTLPNLKLCIAPYCEPPTFLFATGSATCALGSSYNLTTLFELSNPTGRPVTYTCNPAEATISGTTITPHVGGEITITAHIDANGNYCEANAYAQLNVTCTEPNFEFSQYGVFCTIGNSVAAPSYTTNSTSSSVTYSSANETVATVNSSTGEVTGISEGYTTITAYLASSGNFCQKTATFVAYISPDESCMPFTSGNCNVHLSEHCESPFYSNSYYSYSYVQMLYPAEELIASGLSAGKIDKIAFHYYGHPSPPHEFSQKFRVFIGETTATSLYDSWATPTAGFVEKFSGSKSFYENTWTYIELTDGYDWDGTSNIVVAINTYDTELPVSSIFCTRNSEQLARYVGKQSSEISSATEIPLNANKLPSFDGSPSVYRADIKFCQDASTVILPIELSKFEAKCYNGRVNLWWSTESETNNEAFIVERSTNAVDFIEIARIGGSMNSIETINYQYTDDDPGNGDNYYRLVQIDSNGTRNHSEIIVAKCQSNKHDEMQVEAFPNPFDEELTVSLYNFDGQNTTIEIIDMLGKTVKSIPVQNPSNYHEIRIDLNGIPQAAYNIRVSTSEKIINRIVVKS